MSPSVFSGREAERGQACTVRAMLELLQNASLEYFTYRTSGEAIGGILCIGEKRPLQLDTLRDFSLRKRFESNDTIV